MSSARPITPSSATDLPGLTTSSMPGPQAGDEALAAVGVAWPAGAEERPPVGQVDFAVQAEQGRARATPRHRRLAPGGVVVEGVGHRVVAPAGHGVLVVGDRVGPHHPHPSQPPHRLPVNCRVHPHLATARCKRVEAFCFLYRQS